MWKMIERLASWVPFPGQGQANYMMRQATRQKAMAEAEIRQIEASQIANATTTAKATIRQARAEDTRKGGTDE